MTLNLKNLKTTDPDLTIEMLDKQIKYLEDLRANLHVPVLEGASSGSVSLDDGAGTDELPAGGVLSEGAADCGSTACLHGDVAALLQGEVEGRTDEGVHEGLSEEESEVSLDDTIKEVVDTMRDIRDLLRIRVQLQALLEENSQLGIAAIERLVEIRNGL